MSEQVIYITVQQRRALLKAVKPGTIFAPPGKFDGTFTIEDTGLTFEVKRDERQS